MNIERNFGLATWLVGNTFLERPAENNAHSRLVMSQLVTNDDDDYDDDEERGDLHKHCIIARNLHVILTYNIKSILGNNTMSSATNANNIYVHTNENS